MHKHELKCTGERRQCQNALAIFLLLCKNARKKRQKTMSLMCPFAVLNKTNAQCEYAHQPQQPSLPDTFEYANVSRHKSLDKLLLHDSCGCRDETLKRHERGQDKRQESGPTELPGRRVHVFQGCMDVADFHRGMLERHCGVSFTAYQNVGCAGSLWVRINAGHVSMVLAERLFFFII